MPLPMVHLAVARLAAEPLQIADLSSFYLGSIAPDGIHMLEGWVPEDKQRSHLGVRGTNDPAGVREFLSRPELQSSRDYALGYAVHNLTDVDWNLEVVPVYHQRYATDPAPHLPWKPAYYSDTDQIDIELYHTEPWREEVWRLLEQAHAADLPGILPAKAADLWNLRTLKWYDEPRRYEDPVLYFTTDLVREFIVHAGRYCVEFCREFL